MLALNIIKVMCCEEINLSGQVLAAGNDWKEVDRMMNGQGVEGLDGQSWLDSDNDDDEWGMKWVQTNKHL